MPLTPTVKALVRIHLEQTVENYQRKGDLARANRILERAHDACLDLNPIPVTVTPELWKLFNS